LAGSGHRATIVNVLGERFASVLAGAQAGEPWAFEQIYRDLWAQVVSYLAGHQLGQEEDLAADVFVALAERVAGFRGEEPAFRAWVFTIAHHRLVDHVRKTNRRRTIVVEPEQMVQYAARGDTEIEAMEAVAADAAMTLIAQLPPAQSEVLLLRVVVGLTAEEVGRIVGKRATAVRALQHRAVRRLAKQLESAGSSAESLVAS
jgi:RNA polymerase sigma factor (sigma-70 family)